MTRNMNLAKFVAAAGCCFVVKRMHKVHRWQCTIFILHGCVWVHVYVEQHTQMHITIMWCNCSCQYCFVCVMFLLLFFFFVSAFFHGSCCCLCLFLYLLFVGFSRMCCLFALWVNCWIFLFFELVKMAVICVFKWNNKIEVFGLRF